MHVWYACFVHLVHFFFHSDIKIQQFILAVYALQNAQTTFLEEIIQWRPAIGRFFFRSEVFFGKISQYAFQFISAIDFRAFVWHSLLAVLPAVCGAVTH